MPHERTDRGTVASEVDKLPTELLRPVEVDVKTALNENGVKQQLMSNVYYQILSQ